MKKIIKILLIVSVLFVSSNTLSVCYGYDNVDNIKQ